MYIKDLLKNGEMELNNSNIEEGNLKVKMLLSNLLGKNKEYLFMHDTEEVEQEIQRKFLKGIDRLKSGEPIQYILEKQEFYGIEFFVNKNVLIPQPDTEILVEEVLEIIKKDYNGKSVKILDLCTGSGAIAISIKKEIQKMYKNCGKLTEVWASDISKEALEVAKINSEENEAKITLIQSDLFENITEKFDIIVSNPPYIESDVIETLPEEVKNEPKLALDGGQDGLDFYRKIAETARGFLNEEGTIAVEIGYNQKDEVSKIFKENNYREIYCKKDFGGNDRIVVVKV